jgi:hypothetical protein
MLGVAVVVVVGLTLAVSGLALAATLGLRSAAELILAVYVVVFTEVVALVFVLSPFGGVRRPVLLLSSLAICAISLGVWSRAGGPRPSVPALRARPSAAVVSIAVVAGLAYAYVLALALGTPPNAIDSLIYHLPRAAFWRQEGGVGYIHDAYDQRLNANPPHAELAVTFILELARDERFATLIQLSSALVCAVAVFALARRLGLNRQEAAFGALVFLTLPVVLLQSSTALNDLVVAAPLLAAAVFLIPGTWQTLGLAVLATALAVGTKVTALPALPVLCAVALAAQPRAARARRLAAIVVGALAGSYWYVVNLVETGRLLGDRHDTDYLIIGDLRTSVIAAVARILDTFEVPGAEGAPHLVVRGLASSDALLYLGAALVLFLVLLVPPPRLRPWPPGRALVAAGLALLPLAVPPASYIVWRLLVRLTDLLDGTNPVASDEWPTQTVASEIFSWFGPLGLFLVAGSAVVTLGLYRSGQASALGLVLALAPPLWLVAFSLGIGYDMLQGRFFIAAVALSASGWGLVLRVRPLAAAVVTIAATTAALSLLNSLEKPSGVHLVADQRTASVWRMDRWEVQAVVEASMAPVFQALEERVPADAAIALALSQDDFGFPAFGPHLDRQVELVPDGSDGRGSSAEWLLASPARAPLIDRACWHATLRTPEGWTLLRASETCSSDA